MIPPAPTRSPLPPRSAAPSRGAARRQLRLAAALLVPILVVGGLAAWLILRPGRRPRPAPPPLWPVVATTIAGNGSPGRQDGIGASAMFEDPFGVAVDSNGTVYVSDGGDANAIRRIGPDGRVETVAGGREGRSDGRGSGAAFNTPSGIALAPDGTLVVADTQNHAIRRMTPDGVVTTVAGGGTPGRADGPAARARFDGPVGVAVAADGTIVVADTYNDAVRTVSPDGVVSTLAGGMGPGFTEGTGPGAQFDTPAGVAVARDGTVYVADTGNDVIRRVDRGGRVSTVTMRAEGPDAMPFLLSRPVGVAIGPDGLLYAGDGSGRVVVTAPNGVTRVIGGSSPGFADGEGARARFNGIAGIAVDVKGSVIVADEDNYLVRALTPPGTARPAGDVFLTALPLLSPEALGVDRLLWPVAPQAGWHELTATLGEARGSYGGDGRERLHAGIDVHADVGAEVLAVRAEKAGRVLPVSGVGDLNEMVRVGLVTYVHVKAGRTRRDASLDPARFQVLTGENGRADRVRVRRGTRFAEGEPVGTANRFAHVHLGVGPRNAEVNPLRFSLPLFSDHVPPTIPARGVRLLDAEGAAFPVEKGKPVVSGRVAIVVEAYDRADGIRPNRRLGIYSLGYQVFDSSGAPLPGFESPRTTVAFDRLPSTPGAGRMAYQEGSGITVYGSRATRFRLIATNEVRDGEAREGWWDTTGLAPGRYRLRVVARDLAGNEATKGVDVVVR